MHVAIDRRALRSWYRQVRKHYPREAFGYLIGSRDIVMEIWTPRDIAEHNAVGHVMLPQHWYQQAQEAAEESYLHVIGCVHSHPDDEYDGCPSQDDLRDLSQALWGITIVRKIRGSVRVVRTDWRGPLRKVEANYV